MANTPLIVNIFPSNIITLFYNIGNRIFVVRYVEKGHLILADAPNPKSIIMPFAEEGLEPPETHPSVQWMELLKTKINY
jgi:hypothetical protein